MFLNKTQLWFIHQLIIFSLRLYFINSIQKLFKDYNVYKTMKHLLMRTKSTKKAHKCHLKIFSHQLQNKASCLIFRLKSIKASPILHSFLNEFLFTSQFFVVRRYKKSFLKYYIFVLWIYKNIYNLTMILTPWLTPSVVFSFN